MHDDRDPHQSTPAAAHGRHRRRPARRGPGLGRPGHRPGPAPQSARPRRVVPRRRVLRDRPYRRRDAVDPPRGWRSVRPGSAAGLRARGPERAGGGPRDRRRSRCGRCRARRVPLGPARAGVLLPVRHGRLGLRRRAVPDRPARRLGRTHRHRLLHLPELRRRLLRCPPPPRRRGPRPGRVPGRLHLRERRGRPRRAGRRDRVGRPALRTDPALRALHAAHPVMPVYDDHEFRNNWYRDGTLGRRARRTSST